MRLDLTIATILVASGASADPVFSARPAPTHVYDGGWEHFVGGGLASFDCNGDGLPELYAAGGANPAQLFLNTSALSGAVSFAPTPLPGLDFTGVIGAYPLDIDSDGMTDLAILRVGENYLMRGLGSCDFEPMDDIGFDPAGDWTTAFSATWETGEALPTLAFGNYVDRDDPEGPFEACAPNILYRPDGLRYDLPIALEPGYCALSILFSDWGRNGRADLRVSNDRHYYVRGGEEQMWAMERPTRLYSEADGWQSHQLWGMGIASRDLTGDGISEVYLTSMGDQRFQILLEVSEGPTFADEPYESGATAHRPYTGGDGRPSTGWHAVFGDVDNDGNADLFVAKGNVEQMPGSAMADPNNLLMGSPAGNFREAGLEAGIATMDRSRGAVLVDMNADGLLDLAVVNRRANLELYQNTSTGTGNWLSVALSQTAPNTGAIGSFVELRAGGRVWTQELTIGGGHAGGSLGPMHFGLGDISAVEVRVTWPNGTETDWQSHPVNQQIQIMRPD